MPVTHTFDIEHYSPVVDGHTVDAAVYNMYGEPYRDDGYPVWGQPPYGKHEAVPRGLNQGFDWYAGCRLSADVNEQPEEYFGGWAHVLTTDDNTVWDVRMQVRNYSGWYKGGDGTWVELLPDAANFGEGAYYNGSYGWPPTGAGAVLRDESDNGGGWSINLDELQNQSGSPATGKCMYHYWWTGWYPRPRIPSDATDVFIEYEARLIADTNPETPVANAKFLNGSGIDRYTHPTEVSTGFPVVGYMATRMKLLTPDWQWFSAFRRSEAVFRANPPPTLV